jgi:hypothetical protein
MPTVLAEDGGESVVTRAFSEIGDPSRQDRESDVVLTASLASRLLADLLEAYRSNISMEDARATVGKAWGFACAEEMTLCIEAQANASYRCTAAPG